MPLYRLMLLAALTQTVRSAGRDYEIEANIRYAPHAETVLDILQPPHPAMKDRVGVLVIHGGGWVEGTKEDALSFCLPLVAQDFVVANVEYRLAGAAPAPAAVQDVLAAAKWFHDHAADYRVDPNRIVALGFSAGGHLALLAGMLPAQNEFGPVTKLAAILDFFGVADLSPMLNPTPGNFVLRWMGPRPDMIDFARKLSPVTYVRKDVPPILAIHGNADEVVPYQQSVRLVAELKEAGAKAELITVPRGKHGFSGQESAKLWPQVFQWMKKVKLTR